jgi:hypothetical protein
VQSSADRKIDFSCPAGIFAVRPFKELGKWWFGKP